MTVICSLWNDDHDRDPLYVVAGNPRMGEYQVYGCGYFGDRDDDDIRKWPAVRFARCRRCKGICVVTDYDGWGELGGHAPTCDNEKWPVEWSLDKEYKRAIEARFEHGEQP